MHGLVSALAQALETATLRAAQLCCISQESFQSLTLAAACSLAALCCCCALVSCCQSLKVRCVSCRRVCYTSLTFNSHNVLAVLQDEICCLF